MTRSRNNKNKRATETVQAATPVALANPSRTARLNERAMLVTLRMSRWTARKNDKSISQEVADKYRSDSTMGYYKKHLLPKETLEAIDKIHTAAYNEHCFRTLPWGDSKAGVSGARILASGGYFAYAEKMRTYQREFDDAVRDFVNNYDGYVAEARRRLNGLFDAADYPNRRDIERRFTFRSEVVPVPAAQDFRVDLGDDETELVRQQITATVEARLNDAMGDIWSRIKDVVGHMAERLRAYHVTPEGVSGSFRNTLVTNITDLLDVLPSLNVASDPNVDVFAAEIRAMLTVNDPEVLRDDEKVRNATAAAAEAILAKMEDFI